MWVDPIPSSKIQTAGQRPFVHQGQSHRRTGRCSNPRSSTSFRMCIGVRKFRSRGAILAAATNDEVAHTEERVPDEEVPGSWAWRRMWATRILAYGLPALSIPLADPLMTTVDTIFVGQGCSTLELAAMGPTGNVFSVMSYAFGFMSVATIKRISSAMAAGQRDQVASMMQQALLAATSVGVALVVLTQCLAGPMLASVATPPEVMEAARTYLRVRVLSQPALIICSISQSGLLAMKDSVSPLWAIVTMCAVNCLGDALMVGKLQLGIAGIAWATVCAQYSRLNRIWTRVGLLWYTSAALVLLLCWARRAESPFQIKRLPTLQELRALSSDLGVLWGISTLRTLCYSCVRVGAAALGALPCAAYTTLYAVWMPLSFVALPLRQSAMVFLPPFLEGAAKPPAELTDVNARKWAKLNAEGRQLAFVLMALGSVFGLIAAIVVAIMALNFPWIFTRDAAVWPLVQSTALPAFAALSVSGVMEISEGILLIGKPADNVFLLRSMVTTLLLVNVALQTSHHMSWGLSGVWWALVGFYLLRAVQPVSHIIRHTLQARVDEIPDAH